MNNLQYENVDLYHYTSLHALKSIIENKTIRLTDYRFLNDKTEFEFSSGVLRKCILEMKNDLSIADKILQELNGMQNGIYSTYDIKPIGDNKLLINPIHKENTRVYVLSMTDKRDDLALWFGYGRDGCSIKFNSQELFEFFYRIRDNLLNVGLQNIIRGNVRYGDSVTPEEKKKLLALLKIECNNGTFNLPGILLQLCALRKERAYEYESEYRIGLRYYDEWLTNNGCKAKKVFTEKGGYLKPQLEFEQFPIENIIEEIILSPYNKADTAILGLEEFLFSNGLTKIKVNSSSIKIRE